MLRPSLVVVATLLVAQAAAAEPTRITLWHSYRGAEKEALEQVVTDFNAKSDDIEIDVLAQPNDSYPSKLTTSIPRDNGPDIFIFGHDRIGDWAEAGIIAPLDGLVPAGTEDEFLPETIPPARYDGKLWGLPLAFKSTLLFYNKQLVKKPPATTDELVAMADELGGQDRVVLAYLYDDFYYHALWYFGFGADLWSEDGRLAVDSPASLASMAFVRQLQARGILPKEPSGSLIAQLFNEGKAAMIINGPWFLGEIKDDIDFGVAPLPVISEVDRPATPFLTTEMVLLSGRTRKQDTAVRVLRYLVGPESALIRTQIGKQAVAHEEPWTRPEIAADPVLGVFRQQLPHTRPMGNQPRDRSVWEPTLLMLRKLTRAGASPAEAARAGIRRYAAITRAVPPRASSALYIILAAVIVLGALFALGRGLLGLRDRAARRSAARGWTWISPAITGTVVLPFIPFVVGLTLALFAHRQGDWTFVGLANFRDILGAKTFSPTEPLSFYFALLVTILWTGVNLFLHVAIGLTLALLLSRPALKLRPLYRVLLIIPWAVPNYITALIWKAMFSTQSGVINGILEAFGIDGVAWFSSFPTAFFANVCANAWLGFPFMMVVCLGALQSIPRDLYEAADVDGASGWQKFRHITMPLLRPALLPAILIGTVWTFNQFNIVYLVSGGEPDNATDILISEAYRWAFTRQEQYGYAAAYAALIFVILLGWSIFAARMGKRVEAA